MENSLLVICQFLELSVNTLTNDDKYSRLNRDNLTETIQMHLSQKQKLFFSIFFWVSEMKIKFSTFWKNKLALIADVFSKIRTGKDVVR